MVKNIESIFLNLKDQEINTIVVNGDLKHEFGTISEQEWRNTLKFIDLLSKHCKELVLVRGNHDKILGPIASKRNVKVVDYHIVEQHDNPKEIIKETMKKKTKNNESKNQKSNKNNKNKFLIIHGDKIPAKELLKGVSTIVIGHEHPAISIRSGPRVETFKCFLKGKYSGKQLIVQPSFNSVVSGTNVLRDDILSPFLKRKLDDFEVFVIEDKIYDFGKLKNLRENE